MLFKTKQIFPGQVLRLAGQSLRERSGQLFDDRIVPYLLIVLAFWIVCFVEWTQKVAGMRPDPRFWMAMSILLTIYGGCQAFRLYPKSRRLQLSSRGEQCVTEIFDRLRAKGFVSFHDLPKNEWNIDHIAVGPSGVYAIETKTRSGSGTIEYDAHGQLLLGGRINDSPAVRHVRGAAQTLHLELKKYLHESYWVTPLLVFAGDWQVQRSCGEFAIDIITADELEDYFERQPSLLTDAEVAHICSHLERPAGG